ncbi:MAG: DUF2721 domain-containing protein [Gammaproteobacteria bacterium]
MTLSITDPSFLFPAISLLFLAYTNRYLAIAGIIRALNKNTDERDSSNLMAQIESLHLRITLIKYMQAFGVLAFLLSVFSMLCLMWEQQQGGEVLFIGSLVAVVVSLLLSLAEILRSGDSLKIELNRTRRGKS